MVKTKKPIIAISLDMQNDSAKYSYSKFPWYALRTSYSDAVASAGGMPIMLPFDASTIDEALDLADGLIIPGGDNDIDPAFFGQKILSDTVIINHERTSYDMKLLEKALERDIPFLGICYGMQLLNTFLGGSLIQDIKEMRPEALNHTQPHPKDAPWHKLEITNGTKLSSIAKNRLSWDVNSTHHQAIDIVGKDLVVSAICPEDNIIEAVEYTKNTFAIGVEWHPEYQKSELDIEIFKAFIEAAKETKQSI
ncbi:MAG UNVERIFIED_CONTAM: gamma-glutamyl-gamma-aminobutyrate hydrolase family protein [Rickettsiaceae bacterium]